MRIVLLNQFFWPDAVATSQILSDVAGVLAEEHDVVVICAESGATIDNEGPDLGRLVSIIRTKSANFGHRNSKRLLSYVSYLAGSVWHGLRIADPDQFLTLTTPAVLPIIGSVLSKLRGARHVIWEMDVYPDIATDIGFLKKGGIVAIPERQITRLVAPPCSIHHRSRRRHEDATPGTRHSSGKDHGS